MAISTEPFERVLINVEEQYQGAVIEALSSRRAEMVGMQIGERGGVRLGVRDADTRPAGVPVTLPDAHTEAPGVLATLFEGYQARGRVIWARRKQGSLIASDNGAAQPPFGLANAEERGELFIGAGVEVYQGMIIGKNARDGDLEINATKMKPLTNIRSSTSDIAVRLTRPIEMSLEKAIEYIGADELLEVTPKNLRMRKRELDPKMRRRAEKSGE